MKKTLPLFIILPLLVLYFFLKKEPVPETVKFTSQPKRTAARTPSQHRPHRLLPARHSMDKRIFNRIPQSVESSFKRDPSIKLSAGHVYLKNVQAVPRESFQSSMGEEVYQDDLYVFFKGAPGKSLIPVALMKSTNQLYPISSIIHVREVTPALRQKLLASGHEQYYYHPSLQLLSLYTQGGNVLKSYSDLESQGYKVELEVLKPMPGAL